MTTSENFILEEIVTNTQSYRFGTTDLNFTIIALQEVVKALNVNGIAVNDISLLCKRFIHISGIKIKKIITEP